MLDICQSQQTPKNVIGERADSGDSVTHEQQKKNAHHKPLSECHFKIWLVLIRWLHKNIHPTALFSAISLVYRTNGICFDTCSFNKQKWNYVIAAMYDANVNSLLPMVSVFVPSQKLARYMGAADLHTITVHTFSHTILNHFTIVNHLWRGLSSIFMLKSRFTIEIASAWIRMCLCVCGAFYEPKYHWN